VAENANQIVADLRQEGILRHVSPEDLEALKFYGVFGEYGQGEVVIHENSHQDQLYIIISGKLEVVVHQGGEEGGLGIIESGDCIGEIGIFEPGTASATVRVLETAVLWHLDVTSLQSFFEQSPVGGGQVMLGIAQLLTKRLRQANHALVEQKLLPKHLAVRSGKVMPPIKPEDFGKSDEEKPGLLGIFKSRKNPASQISGEIKLKPKETPKKLS
jgi:CRP-like cAMP-binding protein